MVSNQTKKVFCFTNKIVSSNLIILIVLVLGFTNSGILLQKSNIQLYYFLVFTTLLSAFYSAESRETG